tara:strand:+ start:365 stop:703 length:339 start_codon:yes stop_codon:yes gene_type:complete
MVNKQSRLFRLFNLFDQIAVLFLDDEKWSKYSRRVVLSLIVLAGILVVHTSLIYSPNYLVGALYHGRGMGVPQVISMDDKKSEKILERLHGIYLLFHGDKPVKKRSKKPHVP